MNKKVLTFSILFIFTFCIFSGSIHVKADDNTGGSTVTFNAKSPVTPHYKGGYSSINVEYFMDYDPTTGYSAAKIGTGATRITVIPAIYSIIIGETNHQYNFNYQIPYYVWRQKSGPITLKTQQWNGPQQESIFVPGRVDAVGDYSFSSNPFQTWDVMEFATVTYTMYEDYGQWGGKKVIGSGSVNTAAKKVSNGSGESGPEVDYNIKVFTQDLNNFKTTVDTTTISKTNATIELIK